MPFPVLDEALRDMLETVKLRTTFTLEPCRGGYLIKCSDNRAEDIFLRYGVLLMKSGQRPQFSFMEQKMSLQEVFLLPNIRKPMKGHAVVNKTFHQ